MIDGKSGDAKNPIFTPKVISYLRSTHQHSTEALMKLFESEVFRMLSQFHRQACNFTVARSQSLGEDLQLLQHGLSLRSLVLPLSSLLS